MDGMTVIGAIPGGGVSDPYRRIVSAVNLNKDGKPDYLWQHQQRGDFNSDGNPDYLWQHQVRGDIYIWFTDGYHPTGESHYIPARDDTNWKIVGPK
jgi:hypothetical protein